MDILVDDKIVSFNRNDFPMLISGIPSAGSSFFSIGVMINLFKKGEKIVLFSAYEQAKDLFREQFRGDANNNALIIESGDDNLFLEQLDKIQDLSERIVLYKNIDNYDSKLFSKLKDMKLVIFSGDIDKCEFREELMKKEFKTKIFFSYPKDIEIENKISLPKYHGHIISEKYNGLIRILK
ncbi:MAG: hypothetical protein WCS86_03765 [Candidatus Paceibacterota bacterium]